MNQRLRSVDVNRLLRPYDLLLVRHCPVRAKISPDGEIIWLKNPHNHEAELEGQSKTILNRRVGWLNEIREEPQAPPIRAILKQRRP